MNYLVTVREGMGATGTYTYPVEVLSNSEILEFEAAINRYNEEQDSELRQFDVEFEEVQTAISLDMVLADLGIEEEEEEYEV